MDRRSDFAGNRMRSQPQNNSKTRATGWSYEKSGRALQQKTRSLSTNAAPSNNLELSCGILEKPKKERTDQQHRKSASNKIRISLFFYFIFS